MYNQADWLLVISAVWMMESEEFPRESGLVAGLTKGRAEKSSQNSFYSVHIQ